MALLPLIVLLMAALVFGRWQVSVDAQNAHLLLVEIPVAMGLGALVGFILRRPGAGGWAFASVLLGALLGNLAYLYFVESRSVPFAAYEWNYAGFASLLNSLVIGTPAGAFGYVAGLAKAYRVPSGEFAVLALVLGVIPTLFGIAMLPVALSDWATGYIVTFALTLAVFGSGLALILGAFRIWRLRVRGGALRETATDRAGRPLTK